MRKKLVENAKNVGEFLLDELRKIESKKISNIRGRGLMIAFDLENTEKRDKMFDKLFENYLFSIKCGEKSIRFRPPLNLSKDDALKGVKIVEKSLKEI
ncbi:MAG: aminotransferase class III-fold pyridoxal phosphate-dependent enzyme [candidate division WOR-3 bacterium]